jgi:hypothetical protein
MDLIDIDGANDNQFKFIISDRERRSLWFPHIISALEELVADIKCAHSRNVNVERRSNVKQIREITAYLLRNNKKGEIMKEIDTYLYWFRFKNVVDGEMVENGVLDMNEDLYNVDILTKLNEIEEKGVDDNTKDFFNMFEMSGSLIYYFRLKEDISNMLFREAGVNSLSGIDDMKLSVTTCYTPRKFFSKLPKDFPHWFINAKYNVAICTNFRED